LSRREASSVDIDVLVVLAFPLLWTALGCFERARSAPLTIGELCWHFIDVVWLFSDAVSVALRAGEMR
jgi:heme/copper-type cytochrome/quinol oxidase subunit 3